MTHDKEAIDIQDVHKIQKLFFLSGKTRSLNYRLEVLVQLRSLLKQHEKEIAQAVYKDFGKSFFRVRENELGLVYMEIRKTLKNLKKWSRPYRPSTNLANLPGKSRVYAQPYGNTLVISPWNYPVQLAIVPVVSALAAGNTVIIKPSEITSNTASTMAGLINENFPPELIYVQQGGASETNELLKLKFDKIFFTGSSEVGRIVMKAAAEHLTPVTLELGGKNPVLVLPDCNLKMSAKRIVWGKLHNGGQACVAADHVYVHESIADEFANEVQQQIELMMNRADGVTILPQIVNPKHFERLMGLIDRDKVTYGGRGFPEVRRIEPTIMQGVTDEDKVMKEEIFGPILPILTYSDLDTLFAQLAEQPSPLAMYIFTSNIRKARKIQKEFRSGGGVINDTVLHFINSNLPFGGFGDSGMGSYHGRAGFEAFTHRKSVLSKPTWFELWVKHPPYTEFKLKLIKLILR